LLRLLVKKARGETIDDEPAPPPPGIPPPLPRDPTQNDEERIRKFLEALGQPTTNAPPPRVSPRPVPAPITEFQRTKMEEAARAARRRSVMAPLPPLTTVPPQPSPRRVVMPRPMPPRSAEPFDIASQTPPPNPQVLPPLPAEAYSVAPVAPSSSIVQTDPLFRSRDDLRRAIILREILGPPRSLQPLDVGP
jgi:hypothetical protein